MVKTTVLTSRLGAPNIFIYFFIIRLERSSLDGVLGTTVARHVLYGIGSRWG